MLRGAIPNDDRAAAMAHERNVAEPRPSGSPRLEPVPAGGARSIGRPDLGRCAPPAADAQPRGCAGVLSRRGAAALPALLLAAPARAQPRAADGGEPDASIEIQQVRVGVAAIGASVGGGRLRSGGKEYGFTVRGLALDGVGVASLAVRGEVFGLRRVEDFQGLYTEEAADSPASTGARRLRNAAGVELRLWVERSGGPLRLSEAGITIELR